VCSSDLRDLSNLYVTWSDTLRGFVVYGFEQSLNSSLHPPFMVIVAQVVRCELSFQAVRVGRIENMSLSVLL
jgi:hypothetical protein